MTTKFEPWMSHFEGLTPAQKAAVLGAACYCPAAIAQELVAGHGDATLPELIELAFAEMRKDATAFMTEWQAECIRARRGVRGGAG